MRYILVLISVLSITVCANAEMIITVNGGIPLVDIVNIPVNSTANIGLIAPTEMPQGTYYLGILDGEPGSLDDSEMIVEYAGGIVPPPWPPEPPPGLKSWIEITFTDTAPPISPVLGTLVKDITFLCEGPGNVTIRLFDSDLSLLDTQVIHQVPEPASALMMSLGALIINLCRKKAK